jgi:serine/threonine-protein kinase
MGEVWQARDTRLGREVALKVLPDAFARDGDRLARFEREARLLASLNHANIASIYGLEQFDGAQVLVLELVEGETLADRLVRGPIPVEEAVRLALQIAEALEAAHEKGIVHRDLKPANVKVTPAGKVKVLDFGLAKLAEASGPGAQASAPDLTHSPTLSLAATQQGIILGTAAYMSPEQAAGAPTDARTDIWSFGVVLFEMLTGRQLFDGKSVSHILADVLRTDPDWSRLPSHLHPRLRLLLERCLEKEARDRAHHIADVRVDLQKVLADPAGMFVRPSAPDTRVAPRSRQFALMATAGVVAIIAGVAAWTLKPGEPRQVVRFAHELPSPRQFRATQMPVVAISPDGRRVVYNTSEGLYLLSIDALDARLIPGTEQGVGNVMFSPDGQWIAFVGNGGLQKIPVAGGPPVTLVRQGSPATTNLFTGASWTAADRILVGLGETVASVPANGGTPEALFKVEGGLSAFPELLPDGRTVLFTLAGPQGDQVAVHSLGSGSTKVLFPGTRPHYVTTGHVAYVSQNSLFAQPFDLSNLATAGSPVPLVEGILVNGVAQYAISTSGSLVYASAASTIPERTLGIASVDGVTTLDLDPRLYSSPRVSPDGTRLVVQTTPAGGTVPILSATATIWVYDLNGKTAIRQLTQQGKNFHPIWTHDSKRVTFASDREGPMSIYWQPADGSGTPERLTTAEKGTQHFPDSWSPDGRTLVYQVFSSTEAVDLWTMSLDSRDKPAPLTKGAGRNHGAVFSPDGKWLAYGSTEGSQIEQIYVEPIPRRPGVKHQITRSEGAFPVWSRDGRSLFFRRVPRGTEGTGTHLVQVEIVPGSAFAWQNERELPIKGFLLFGGQRDYDVMPDGKRFVMVFPPRNEAGELARPRINVVVNWLEELKARVP